MIIRTSKGMITIDNRVISVLSGRAAMNCFGVKGLVVPGLGGAVVSLFTGDHFHEGVSVSTRDGAVRITLHIAVQHGMNMSAVSKSIMNEVKYVVERQTGLRVSHVNVSIDAIILAD